MIRRAVRLKNYSQISNIPIGDAKLSWAARGLLVYLLSKPDGWRVNANHLVSQSPLGKDGVYAILKELKAAGYLVMERLKDGSVEYVVDEEPKRESPDEAQTGKAQTGNSRSVVNTETATKTEKDLLSSDEDEAPKNSITEQAEMAVSTFNDSELVKTNGGKLSKVLTLNVERMKLVKKAMPLAEQLSIQAHKSKTVTREFWEEYWGIVALDDFASGRSTPTPGKGHDNWKPDFDYLLRSDVMTRLIEKAVG